MDPLIITVVFIFAVAFIFNVNAGRFGLPTHISHSRMGAPTGAGLIPEHSCIGYSKHGLFPDY